MKKSILLMSVSISMLGLTSCTLKTRPVHTGQTQSMPSVASLLTDQKRSSLIELAAIKNGWRCQKFSDEKSKCTLNKRDHSATVEISHNKKSYTINYLDSANLKYKQGQIHQQYNKWIKNLEIRIFQIIAQEAS